MRANGGSPGGLSALDSITASTQEERKANYERMLTELGVDRMGLGPDVPKLPPRAGLPGLKPGSSLSIEAGIRGVQMYEFGEIWPRPGLDLKSRSAISVATLAALNRPNQLYRHINIALNIGFTPEEIHEMLLQISPYAGLPAWEDGVGVANEVFVVRGILPEGSGISIEPVQERTDEEIKKGMLSVRSRFNVGKVGKGSDAPNLQPLAGALSDTTGSVGLSAAREMGLIHVNYGLGEITSRPGLELRYRSLINCTVLQVLLQTNEMNIHFNNALNLGITPDELFEALSHAAVYGSNSGWHTVLMVAAQVFAQHREAAKK
jgi:4-carboxymuconolactone decarboxylase